MTACLPLINERVQRPSWGAARRAVAWPVAVERLASNETLCDLLEAVAERHDRSAFATLFRHFAPRLKAFGMRQGADAAAAEELVQETMLSVWRKAGTFDRQRATANTWVFTIVRNKRIDLFRRENRPEVTLDDVPDAVSDEEGADRSVEVVQVGGAVRNALATLSPEQLEVVHKAFYEDKSHSEIAAELNLPLGTVKSRIRLALTRLRAAVSEDYR